jgi:hypothetical protein
MLDVKPEKRKWSGIRIDVIVNVHVVVEEYARI